MIEKHYADDWAKSKTRVMVYDLIERTLLRTRKPSQLYVLCFPGVDATEVYEVYDRLRIPRQNITGVERDPQVAQELINKNLGIRIVTGTLEDYVSKVRNLFFDVVSLDYTGPIIPTHINTLQQIGSRQLKNEWILHHANLAKRDPEGHRLHLWGAGITGLGSNRKTIFEKALETKNNRLPELKSESYTGLLIAALRGTTKETVMRLRNFIAGQEHDSLIEEIKNAAQDRGLSLDNFDPGDIESSFHYNYIDGRPAGEFLSSLVLGRRLRRKIMLNDFNPAEFLAILTDGLQKTKFHVPREAARYSYISESGAPMVGDIYLLSSQDERLREAGKFAQFYGYPNKFTFRLSVGNKTIEDVLRSYNRARKEGMLPYRDLLKGPLAEDGRLFLGSSAKPVLTKTKAINLLRAGICIEEIRSTHRGWRNKPIAQWKSHVTMGTYDKEILEENKSNRETDEDSYLEKITKEEALNLLSSGIPPKEIYETYPSSFSVGQLAAFKAWQTMRAKKESFEED